MRTLIIDNSNTRTKFVIAENGMLLPDQEIIPTTEISESRLKETLNGSSSIQNWDASIISSVVPDKAQVLKRFLNSKPCHQLSYQSKLPINILYPKPEQIGADRLANTVAAQHLYGGPAIVLDFGTAVTFDILSASEGQEKAAYLGGVIAPGLASMTEGLSRRTALLPHIQLEEPQSAIGKSTEEAMLSGAVYGYRGLVREIINQLCLELPTQPTVIATGGDAALITKELPEIQHLNPRLTLEGLRIIADLNL